MKKFSGAFTNRNFKEYEIKKDNSKKKVEFLEDIEKLFDKLPLKDGMTVSFHHHMRNGDYVLNMIMEEIRKRGYKDITIAPTSIFPVHEKIVPMLEDKTITKIHCDYMSGPVAKAVSNGKCEKECIITTHGGRPREILEEELKIDIAFIATPAVDKVGNGTGSMGESNCGVLGYAIADCQMAENVVLVTDFITEKLTDIEIDKKYVDYCLKVDKIGSPSGIVSGTTEITKDPVGLKIARDTAKFIDESGLLKNGFNFQTGAGGISLAVADELKKIMKEKNIKGGFASGGITDYLVDMLEEGYFEELYDVQCFTIGATKSIVRNKNHHKMSANKYANINNKNNIVDKLDVVILGASEIDLDFNVNVTTGSDGIILGGSGGHADTAAGAKMSIIVSRLFSSRRSVVVDKVKTISTPGETVDVLITDRGIAINKRNENLIRYLKENTNFDIVTMEELLNRATKLVGVSKKQSESSKTVALSKYRDGTILDEIKLV